jgi:polyphosphate glucokinase
VPKATVKNRRAIGIDIGASGIKTAVVDIDEGVLLTEVFRHNTPKRGSPTGIASVVRRLFEKNRMPARLPVGVGFPAVIKQGVAMTATNLHPSWLGQNVAEVLHLTLDRRVVVLNDADAAGLAEARFGVGRGVRGLMALVTLGTGLGTALVIDGRLVPNTELGNVRLDGTEADFLAAKGAIEDRHVSWEEYGANLGTYLQTLDRLVWPDLVVLGGGVSAEAEHFLPFIHARPPVIAASLGNGAGIIGAALFAVESKEALPSVLPIPAAGDEPVQLGTVGLSRHRKR